MEDFLRRLLYKTEAHFVIVWVLNIGSLYDLLIATNFMLICESIVLFNKQAKVTQKIEHIDSSMLYLLKKSN